MGPAHNTQRTQKNEARNYSIPKTEAITDFEYNRDLYWLGSN